MAAPKGNQYAKGLTKDKCPNVGRPEKYTEEWLKNEAKVLLDWMKIPENYYFKTFAYERGYRPDDFDDFCAKSKEFSIAYRHCKDLQEQKFIHNALTKTWDAAFTSKVMARVCGPMWKNSWDKEETKEAVQPVVVVNKIYKNQLEDKESE